MRSIVVIGGSASPIGPALVERLLSQNYIVYIVDGEGGVRRAVEWAVYSSSPNSKRRIRYTAYEADVPGDFDFQLREVIRSLNTHCVAVIDLHAPYLPNLEPDTVSLYIIVRADLDSESSPCMDGLLANQILSISVASLLYKAEMTRDWSTEPRIAYKLPRSQTEAITLVQDVVDFISNFVLINPITMQLPRNCRIPILSMTDFSRSLFPNIPIDLLVRDGSAKGPLRVKNHSSCESLFKFTPSMIVQRNVRGL